MTLWVAIIEGENAAPKAYGPFESEVVAMRLATSYSGSNSKPVQIYELRKP